MEHFYQLGYQRIAFIGGNPNSSAGQERIEGYQRALTRSGLPFDPLLVIASPPTQRGGYEGVQRLLAIQLVGLKVGAGFGVIGFNDVSADTEPALTTIDTAPRQLGETAAELLLRRIRKPESLVQTTILHPRLIVRDSCGPYPND